MGGIVFSLLCGLEDSSLESPPGFHGVRMDLIHLRELCFSF